MVSVISNLRRIRNAVSTRYQDYVRRRDGCPMTSWLGKPIYQPSISLISFLSVQTQPLHTVECHYGVRVVRTTNTTYIPAILRNMK